MPGKESGYLICRIMLIEIVSFNVKERINLIHYLILFSLHKVRFNKRVNILYSIDYFM